MNFPRRTSLTLLALPTLALVAAGVGPLSAGAAAKHPTVSSVLVAANAALLTENSVHVQVATIAKKVAGSVVADIGKTSGREVYHSGTESFIITVTPTTAYLSGSKDGLINIMDLTASEQKEVGTDSISMKKGTSPYSTFEENLTAGTLTHLLPKAKGTTLLAQRDASTGGYQLKWKEAATSSSAASTTVITISAGKKALPIKESVTTAGGKSETTFSRWGESIKVTVPKATIAYTKIFPSSK
jgi:hypothetical protein